MQDPTLVLRDIHQVDAPAWWPPAPGWWLLAAALVAAALLVSWWRRRVHARRRRIAAVFDEAVQAADGAPAQVAAMSELLRRAARRRDPRADRLHGDAWLAFLDTDGGQQAFSEGQGRLLLEGGFQREADPRQVEALREVARARFIEWMTK